ncbi:MAG: class I SAM-dependent methyltransferase [Verrucomicrobiae bacterium]|nr:class I SAM-dependent methyltransferase [Verrucomicrobiae bacterium]
MKKVKSPYFTYPRALPETAARARDEKLIQVLGGFPLFDWEFFWLVRPYLRSGELITVLDLAMGNGVFSRRMATQAAARKWPIHVSAVDFDRKTVDEARELCRDHPKIELAFYPFFELERLPAGAFDFVICAFALHLYPTKTAIALLQTARRLARCGLLVLDFRRTRFLTFFAQGALSWLTRDPEYELRAARTTQQAFSEREMKNLAFHAAIPDTSCKNRLFHQILASRRKTG